MGELAEDFNFYRDKKREKKTELSLAEPNMRSAS